MAEFPAPSPQWTDETILSLLAEVDRLRSIHGHDFTNAHQEPVTCICGVTYMDWLEARKNGSDR